MTETLNIYQIISKVGEEVGALAPEQKGGVPFAFRGIDAVIGHLVPALRKYGIITVPEVLEQKVSTREIGNNKAITQTEVLTRFTFYAPDGTSISATTAGLAQDYADRSTAQAQSVAFRVALLQTFTLPTHDKEPEVAGEETQKFLRENAGKPQESAAPVEDGRASVIDRIKKASTAVKDSDGNTGSKLLSALVEANPGEFSNAAGEPQSFQSVWANAPIDVLERLEKLLGSVK